MNTLFYFENNIHLLFLLSAKLAYTKLAYTIIYKINNFVYSLVISILINKDK